jgi:hypothetical protein
MTSWDHHRMNEVCFYIVIGYIASSLFHNMSRVDWMLTGAQEKSHCVVLATTRQILPNNTVILQLGNSKLHVKMYHFVQRKRNHCQILSSTRTKFGCHLLVHPLTTEKQHHIDSMTVAISSPYKEWWFSRGEKNGRWKRHQQQKINPTLCSVEHVPVIT